MNYRHAFHAGNFADLVKHAALTRLLGRLLEDASPLTVVDTHAGAGLYDLGDENQARSKEAEAGVARLAERDLPPEFTGLADAIRKRNRGRGVKSYPGSPALIIDALREGDRYVACELRDEEHGDLSRLLGGATAKAEARQADGYATAVEVARQTKGRLFVLIDPPFEAADDYVRIVETVAAVLKARPRATVLVWLPIKDLETLDAFVRRLENVELTAVIAEARMRPLDRPMRMNGCALAGLNLPGGFERELEAISAFVVEALGEPGGRARVWTAG